VQSNGFQIDCEMTLLLLAQNSFARFRLELLPSLLKNVFHKFLQWQARLFNKYSRHCQPYYFYILNYPFYNIFQNLCYFSFFNEHTRSLITGHNFD
jgi:hypothetical protein